MKKPSSNFIFVLILAFCLTQIANAEIMVGTSIEWLTCSSDQVAVGMLKFDGEEKGVHSVIYENYKLDVLENIKGDKNEAEIRFVVRTLSKSSAVRKMAGSGHPVIVFLSKNGDGSSEKFLNSKLEPTNKQFPLSVLNLDEPGKYVIDTKFNVIKKKANIIETARKSLRLMDEFLKKDSSVKIESLSLEVPMDSEAFSSLYSGSVRYLTVPNFMFPDASKSFFDNELN